MAITDFFFRKAGGVLSHTYREGHPETDCSWFNEAIQGIRNY